MKTAPLQMFCLNDLQWFPASRKWPPRLNQKIVWMDVFGPEGELILIFASVFHQKFPWNVYEADVFEILPWCNQAAPPWVCRILQHWCVMLHISNTHSDVGVNLSRTCRYQLCCSYINSVAHNNGTDRIEFWLTWIRPGSCLGKHELKRCLHQTLCGNLILRQIQLIQLLLTWRMRQISQTWIFWLETVGDK